jgi:hypothetical protein
MTYFWGIVSALFFLWLFTDDDVDEFLGGHPGVDSRDDWHGWIGD